MMCACVLGMGCEGQSGDTEIVAQSKTTLAKQYKPEKSDYRGFSRQQSHDAFQFRGF